jgi:aminoglycoside 3-N-acetyltransferase
MVGSAQIHEAITALGLSGRPLCIHSSLRSFGHVAGGAGTIVDEFLAAGCTVLVPTFSGFAVPPPPHLRPARNGWNYNHLARRPIRASAIYTPDSWEIDADMGAIPAHVLHRPDRVRGNHPLNSFSAIGPLAAALIAGQQPHAVYAPLDALCPRGGFVVMMGVGLDAMTLLHLAEQRAGRTLFRRWANGPDGEPMMVEVGGCSDGFPRLEPALAPLMREIIVSNSRWRIYPAPETLARAAAAIAAQPSITHCGHSDCERCNDAVQGGPFL